VTLYEICEPDGKVELHGGPYDGMRFLCPPSGTLVFIHARENFTRVECTYKIRKADRRAARMVLEKMTELPPIDLKKVPGKKKEKRKR
jgi:hypothetical protein